MLTSNIGNRHCVSFPIPQSAFRNPHSASGGERPAAARCAMPETRVVGKSIPRVDARPKATGEAKYTADLVRPGTLFGKVLRSPYPHARILHIDAERARRVPGVRAVLTAADTPMIPYGLIVPDELPLAASKVRYIGDEVAAVAAADADAADEALSLIRVEYEELPAVFDPEEAMRPGAPRIHDEFELNVADHVAFDRGDIEAGWREAAVRAEIGRAHV